MHQNKRAFTSIFNYCYCLILSVNVVIFRQHHFNDDYLNVFLSDYSAGGPWGSNQPLHGLRIFDWSLDLTIWLATLAHTDLMESVIPSSKYEYFYVPLFIIIESAMDYWLTYTVVIMLRCQLLIRLRPQTPIQVMMTIHQEHQIGGLKSGNTLSQSWLRWMVLWRLFADIAAWRWLAEHFEPDTTYSEFVLLID